MTLKGILYLQMVETMSHFHNFLQLCLFMHSVCCTDHSSSPVFPTDARRGRILCFCENVRRLQPTRDLQATHDRARSVPISTGEADRGLL